MDYILSITLLIILFLPFLFICFLIKLDSKGPIFNKSYRVGKNKSIFIMYKFRTMKLNTPIVHSNDLKNSANYITKIGVQLRKYSIDELPQILNVLLGDMSLVGPRPSLENQFELIKKRDFFEIHKIKPGLTGLAQINGRDNLDMNKKVELDNFYKNNQNIFLDIKIIIKTILIVIRTKDIRY